MKQDDNLTIWQRLGKTFGPNSLLNQDYPTYKFDKEELLRTKDKSEYEREKLQAQQSYYLASQWGKVENNLYSQAIYYEPSRLSAQYDYESMEFTPEISAALDIYAEESTTTDENGFILQIYSESKRIKSILADLFNNTLDIDTNLTMWTRNTPVREDSIIPLLDGSETTIKDLSSRVKNGEDVWSYAIQDVTNAIVPSKIIWCDLTRKDSELIRVTLDDGTYIDTTPDHEYMLRNGSFERADQLKPGQSLMPFYTRKSIKNKDRIDGYEKVYNPRTGKFKFTHTCVSHECVRDLENEKLFKESFSLRKNIKKSINLTTLQKVFKRKGYKSYLDYLTKIKPEIINDKKYKKTFETKTNQKVLNHKVVSVEKLIEKSDVYCLEAVGPNGEHDRHNFPICSKDHNGNYTRNGVFLANCKYGDNFVYLKLDPEKGIVGCQQLPTIEIERRESGTIQKMTTEPQKPEEKKPLHFEWKNKNMVFQSWEIAHFRLLGDDRKLPYGTSMLEKARRIWKQLLLSEDAMLIYRISRAPERKLFKVFVGNMSDEDVEAYVQRFANKFKREQIVDSKTGNVDLRFNQMAVDQDFFIPVRDPAAPSPIETLPGATNLSEIADIEYIQKKLLTALRVPKAFLGFEEVVGNGKDLSLQDIRFARTINRIQKSMLQELNKIAIIHLFILGFEDELSNFNLSLTNPSAQSDLIKLDLWKDKVLLYRDLVTDPGNGIQATSSTWAKKHVFGWSDEEVKLDLQQQRIERAVGEELKATPTVINKTGIFNNIDRLYGSITGTTEQETSQDTESGFDSMPQMGGGGLSDLGGEFEGGGEELGGGELEGSPLPEPEIAPEGRKKDMNILVENDLIEGKTIINLGEAQDSLGEISKELDKLLN